MRIVHATSTVAKESTDKILSQDFFLGLKSNAQRREWHEKLTNKSAGE